MVFKNGGLGNTMITVSEFVKIVEDNGAGEILINSIENDGMRTGYDIELLDTVCAEISIPVIGLGGAGEWSHLGDALEKTQIDAVAVANILHFFDQSVFLAKKYLYERGLNVRKPDLFSI